jgi:porphobilinogen synthase
MAFPKTRLRRLRANRNIRRLIKETKVFVDDLVYPLFVRPGSGLKEPITSMADCCHFSPDTVADEAKEVADLGVPAVLLFGIPKKKDDKGSEAWADDGTVQQAVREIKRSIPELIVITDICLCGYTSHGHCGIIKRGKIDNDSTCEVLAKVALSHASAGADVVAPSDMMDGRVGIIRQALDKNGFTDTAIMSYAAKFASCFYGPFRGAAESAPDSAFAGTELADRRTYQMDTANARQAMREIALDIDEGADIVMIKPALTFLDIIAEARQKFDVPIAAYFVSGEYMMVHCAAQKGLLELDAAMNETLNSIKRAGADIIITYFAKKFAV